MQRVGLTSECRPTSDMLKWRNHSKAKDLTEETNARQKSLDLISP